MQTLILDSSQLTTWSSCSRSWQYVNGLNLISINKANPAESMRPSEAIAAGTLGHKYLEIYYTELAKGNREGAVAAAMAFDPDKADLADQQQFPLDAALRKRVRNRFVDYIMTYSSQDILPVVKRKPTVIVRPDGSLCDSFEVEPLVERGFSYKLFESKEYLFVLEGRIDLIGRTKDLSMIWEDHKWQLREHALYPKSIQFRNYSLVTKLNMAIINYVRLHDKVNEKTFVRQPISFSSLEMYHWEKELTEMFVAIAKEVAAGHYPQNRGACGGAWGKPCQFTPICECYNPEEQARVMRDNFTQRKVWRPW